MEGLTRDEPAGAGIGRPERFIHAATRFVPPRLRDEYVLRSNLVERFLTPGVRGVVVTGPAGSGKSTVLAQAHDACTDAAWLSVEPADDDPAALWSALIDAVAHVTPEFGRSYRHRLDSAGPEAVDAVLALFVNELADRNTTLRLFLDDLHLITGAASIDSLHRLLQQLPHGGCLVVASREKAPFPLGRLRIERAIVEVDADDLAMDIDEARSTIGASGIDPSDGEVAALVKRTEGWVAGLAWAALVMRDRPDPMSFVDTVKNLDGELAPYLVEEVLDQRSPELRSFMLETSILDRFDTSLCNHLRNRNDSRALLDELDRTNSFLVPLDQRGECFRYHHLVRDVLVARRERTSPSRVPALHLRAATWLRQHDEVVASIRHARAAGEDRLAADILCANWWTMMNGGRIETAHALFEEFGAERICAYQPLAIAATVLYSVAGDHQRATRFLHAAERGDHEGPPPDGTVSIESSLAIMRGSIAFDGVDATLADGLFACELEPEDSAWRQLATFIVALGHIWRGELEAAEPAIEFVMVNEVANEAIRVYAHAELALIQLSRGDLLAASASAESACVLATETGLDTILVTGLARGAAAAASIALCDHPAANKHLDAAHQSMANIATAMPLDAMHTRIVLADAAIKLGRLSEARGYIDDASRTSRRYRDCGVMTAQVDSLATQLDEAMQRAPVEVSDRELAVLELLPSELSIQGIADTLFISKETVKTHRRNIYKKLDVNSRDDAVVAARRVGLLTELATAESGSAPSD